MEIIKRGLATRAVTVKLGGQDYTLSSIQREVGLSFGLSIMALVIRPTENQRDCQKTHIKVVWAFMVGMVAFTPLSLC